MIIKKIDVMSVGKIGAFIYGIFGVLVAFAAFIGSMVTKSMMDPEVYRFGVKEGIIGGYMQGLGVLAIIGFPLLYAVMGFVGGVVGAWVYNFAAGKIGGIKLVVEQ